MRKCKTGEGFWGRESHQRKAIKKMTAASRARVIQFDWNHRSRSPRLVAVSMQASEAISKRAPQMSTLLSLRRSDKNPGGTSFQIKKAPMARKGKSTRKA